MSILFWIGVIMLLIPFAAGIVVVLVTALRSHDYDVIWGLAFIGWIVIALFIIAFGISYSHVSH